MIPIKFEFPDTGEGVTEGKFLEWKVDEGDEIEEDEVVGEAETDKAVVEIPAPSDGKVKNLKAAPGDTVHVGEVIMELKTGEDLGKASEDQKNTENNKDSSPEEEKSSTGSENPVVEDVPVSDVEQNSGEEADSDSKSSEKSSDSQEVLALPKVRKLAREKGVKPASIKTGERITEEDVLQASKSGESASKTGKESSPSTDSSSSQDVSATPAVRKLAREKNIDIGQVEGSGQGGKITRQDILDYEESGGEIGEISENNQKIEEHPVHSDREVKRRKMSGIRQKIAERMENSRFTAPHVTHTDKADLTNLKELREEEKDEVEPHLTYLPFIMKAAVEALQKFPELNAELDTQSNEIVEKKYYDFNIAVDTERGLLVPRVKNVDKKSIVELASDVAEKAEKAKNGELARKEMENGSFSITNQGVIGGEEFTPIINYPQTAILGIGRIGKTAEVIDDEVVPRTTVKLSLSYDHRLVDGATAARFMNEVIENLEKPEKMLLEL